MASHSGVFAGYFFLVTQPLPRTEDSFSFKLIAFINGVETEASLIDLAKSIIIP